VRCHRGDTLRGLERLHRTNGRERGRDTDAEIDRQLIRRRRAIDKDVLPVEVNGARTRRRIHVIQVASELLRDPAAWDLRPHASHLSRRDVHFVDFVWCG